MATTPELNVIRICQTIQGWLYDEEIELLYTLAREAVHPIVELGSYQGKSTAALALGSLTGHQAPVYAVDPHEPMSTGIDVYEAEARGAFMGNMIRLNLTSIVRLVNLPSQQAAKGWIGAIDLLFIDAIHTYEAVKADFEAWSRFMKPGASILFHDIKLDEVSRAIDEICTAGRAEVRSRVCNMAQVVVTNGSVEHRHSDL